MGTIVTNSPRATFCGTSFVK